MHGPMNIKFTSNGFPQSTSNNFVLQCVMDCLPAVRVLCLSGNFRESNFALICGVCTHSEAQRRHVSKQQILESLSYKIILPYI